MPTDTKKEWMIKANIDYFAPFISLWLACNSWYKTHYSEISSSDRDLINKIKSDFTGRNLLYNNFDKLLSIIDKDSITFKTNLELLHYSLKRANLHPGKINECSFEKAVINYNTKMEVNLIKNVKLTRNGNLRVKDASSVILLDQICVTNNKHELFAGLFEIIYQVRNMLVHGSLKPEAIEHDVVKYCYMILWQIMECL